MLFASSQLKFACVLISTFSWVSSIGDPTAPDSSVCLSTHSFLSCTLLTFSVVRENTSFSLALICGSGSTVFALFAWSLFGH